MNKKCLIVSIYGYVNYGNRLQNYALTKTLSQLGMDVYNVDNRGCVSIKRRLVERTPVWILKFFIRILNIFSKNTHVLIASNKLARYINFKLFNERYLKALSINKAKKMQFDYVVAGSDQVWNMDFGSNNMDYNLLKFAKNTKKISYAASLGMKKLSDGQQEVFIEAFKDYSAISVRESDAKDLLQPLTDIKIEVVLDPTLLLDKSDWDHIATRPDWLNFNNYIIVYFLGERTEEFNNVINNLAKNNNAQIIDIFDEKNTVFHIGPSEFIWLIKNAKYVVTDSYHATVFSIIYEKPIFVLEGYGKREGMSGRFDTLKKICGEETLKNIFSLDSSIDIDYSTIKKNLNIEKMKSMEFLKTVLEK